MPQTNITDNEVMVITYGFVDFLQETDELRKQGFEFNFEDNKTYPQMIGHHFQCIMQKLDSTLKTETKVEELQTVVTPVEPTTETETPQEVVQDTVVPPVVEPVTPEVVVPKRGRPSGK